MKIINAASFDPSVTGYVALEWSYDQENNIWAYKGTGYCWEDHSVHDYYLVNAVINGVLVQKHVVDNVPNLAQLVAIMCRHKKWWLEQQACQ